MFNKLKKKIKKTPFIYITYLKLKGIISNTIYDDISHYNRKYKKTHGKYPDLKNPTTYSEKLIWSMIHHRDQRYVTCVDKYEVRDYVKERIGKKYLINVLGIYESFNEIDFDSLPKKFVLKATHGSGWNIIITDKSTINISYLKNMLNYWLNSNYYYINREWPYKYVQKRIVCEEFIGTKNNVAPEDYKFFCFNGEPRLIQLDIGRFSKHYRNVYDTQWNRIEGVEIAHPQDYSVIYPKPDNLEEMLQIARKLSAGFKHVRVDLYNVEGRIFFGELTFFHGAGTDEYFRPYSFHLEIGNWFDLPDNNISNFSNE